MSKTAASDEEGCADRYAHRSDGREPYIAAAAGYCTSRARGIELEAQAREQGSVPLCNAKSYERS